MLATTVGWGRLGQALGLGAARRAAGQATPGGEAEPVTYVDGPGGDVFTAKDNLLHSGAPTINFGTHPQFEVSISRPFIYEYDLSAIPAGAECVSATWYLTKATANGAQAVTCSIYEISAANHGWAAGTLNSAQALAGQSCWAAKAADGAGGVSTPWAGSAGLSTAGVDYETEALGTFGLNSGDAVGTVYAVELDPARVAGWFGSGANNHGILLKSSANGGHLASAQHATAAYRPRLVVVYIPAG